MGALCEHLEQIQIKAREEGPVSKMTWGTCNMVSALHEAAAGVGS